jgi:hypothetical protein
LGRASFADGDPPVRLCGARARTGRRDETFDVGVDIAALVGPYDHGFECTAQIYGVTLERLDEPDRATSKRMRAGERSDELRSQ